MPTRAIFQRSRNHVRSEPGRSSFLPFLYQTSTILQAFTTSTIRSNDVEAIAAQSRAENTSAKSNRPALESLRKSAAGSKMFQHKDGQRQDVKRIRYIPFEGSTGVVDPIGDMGGTTMTRWERQVFQELKIRKMRQISPDPDVLERAEREEEDEEEDEFSVFLEDSFIADPTLRTLALGKASQQAEPLAARQLAAGKLLYTEKMVTNALDVYTRIRKGIRDAPSDVALWRYLETKVFDQVKALRLNLYPDDSLPSSKPKRTNSHKLEWNKRLWALCFPALLQTSMKELSKFPGSPLSLAVLPSLRELGPEAFALGATSRLYNQHLQLLYGKHADVDSFNIVLAEMDRKVYRFTAETQHAIASMLLYANDAQAGRYGPGLREIWKTDLKQRAVDELRRWCVVVDETLAADAIRKARING